MSFEFKADNTFILTENLGDMHIRAGGAWYHTPYNSTSGKLYYRLEWEEYL
jgi:hypothetical protein